MALVRIYEFADDVETHDDELQKRLDQDFEAAFTRASETLSTAFGPGTRPDEEGESSIPVGGVFCAMEWNIGGQRLYLVAAHEDRETPFLLILGVDR